MQRPRNKEVPDWLTPDLLKYLLDRSKRNSSRRLFINNAKRWRDWYRGHLFLAPTKDHDDTSVSEVNATARRNIIGETVDVCSSIFMKNRPVIRRIPLKPEWATLSDDIDAMWLWQWGESFGQTIARSMLEDSEITGMGTLKVFWEFHKSRRRADGGVVLKSVPASSIYVDPSASNDHRGWDASYIIEHMKRFPEEIVAKYGPEAEEALGWRTKSGRSVLPTTPRAWQSLGMSNEDVTGRADGGNTFAKFWPPVHGVSETTEDDRGKTDLYECWLFPDLLYGSELSAGDKVAEQHRFGLIATMVNDRIIRVRPNPFAQRVRVRSENEYGQETRAARWLGHGSHPYVFMHWRRVADPAGNRRFYDCMSMVEWMVSLQFNVNALRRNLAIILRTMANPMLAYNEDALGTPANKIVCAPGQMVKIRGRYRIDEAIRPIGQTQMPPQVGEMIAADIEGMKEAAGVQRGVTGLFPSPAGGTSHTSGEVIGGLQEAAFGPLWKYVEHVGDALEDLSYKMEGLMQQFFTASHYVASSRSGLPAQVQWTGEHRIAQFRRVVIAGATTPMYDLQREQREGFVKDKADTALMSGDERMIRSTLIYLRHMNFPWTEDYTQLLEEELDKLQQMQQGLQGVGAFSVLGGGQAQEGGLAPQGQGVPGAQEAPMADLSVLAEQMGVSEEELMLATAGK